MQDKYFIIWFHPHDYFIIFSMISQGVLWLGCIRHHESDSQNLLFFRTPCRYSLWRNIIQYPQVKVSGQNEKRHKTRPVCPISLHFFSTCWSVSWDDAHQILFSLDKNSLSESIYNGPHPNCTVQLRY